MSRAGTGSLGRSVARSQLTTLRRAALRRAARQGRVALPEDPVAEDGFGFAALVFAEEPT